MLASTAIILRAMLSHPTAYRHELTRYDASLLYAAAKAAGFCEQKTPPQDISHAELSASKEATVAPPIQRRRACATTTQVLADDPKGGGQRNAPVGALHFCGRGTKRLEPIPRGALAVVGRKRSPWGTGRPTFVPPVHGGCSYYAVVGSPRGGPDCPERRRPRASWREPPPRWQRLGGISGLVPLPCQQCRQEPSAHLWEALHGAALLQARWRLCARMTVPLFVTSSCRTATNGQGVKMKKWPNDLQACQDLCLEIAACHAIERTSSGVCEVWAPATYPCAAGRAQLCETRFCSHPRRCISERGLTR